MLSPNGISTMKLFLALSLLIAVPVAAQTNDKASGSGSRTAPQTAGTTIAIRNLNSVLYADGFPSSGCSVGGTTYTTKLDCAWYTAAALTESANGNVTLVMGNGSYDTCAVLREPRTFATINLIGAGIRTSFVNKICLTPATPVIDKPEPVQFSNLTMHDFSILANNKANSCMDLFGLENPYIANINCYSVRADSDHEIEIGENDNGGPGWAEDGVIDNIAAGSPFNGGTMQAKITPTFIDGELTGLSCGSECGTYDRGGAAYLKVFFLGFGHGAVPCIKPPEVSANMNKAGTSIAGFTILDPGSGCRGIVDVQAYESFPVNVGVELNISDSITRNIQSYVGQTAAITTRGGNSKHYGLHPTNVAVGVIDYANSDFEGTECDTLAQYCIDEEGSLGSTISGTNTFQAGHFLPGSSTYFIGPEANYLSYGPQGDLCTGQLPPDYHEFVTTAGPLDTGAGSLPSGVTVFGNDRHCGLGGDYTSSLTIAPGGQLLMDGSSIGPDGGSLRIRSSLTIEKSFRSARGARFDSGGTISSGQSGVATPATNYGSFDTEFASSVWNGSAPARDEFSIRTNVGTGSNPSVTLDVKSTGGSTGVHTANFEVPVTAMSFNGASNLSHTDYWSVGPSLLAKFTALGPVFYEVKTAVIKAVTARLAGRNMSCAEAPTVVILDLGTSPTTPYSDAKIAASLSTGKDPGAFSVAGQSTVIAPGHYLGLGMSAGACEVFPQLDATVTIE
jgi:hypothetical protein